MNTLASLERRHGRRLLTLLAFIVIPVVGVIDYLTGHEIELSIFYLVPVSVVAWVSGRSMGSVAALFGAVTWIFAEVAAGHPYADPGVPLWNTLILFGFFLVVVLLLVALRRALEHERELGRVDDLTGAVNSRFFLGLVEMEIARSRRHGRPFTIAYIDIDDFKGINDRLGHSAGDSVLRRVAQLAIRTLRRTDVVARLGGDEFAILFPETDQEPARAILSKVRDGILREMERNEWPVTFSVGVLTCVGGPSTTDEIIQRADALMYSVKRGGKNGIAYDTCGAWRAGGLDVPPRSQSIG